MNDSADITTQLNLFAMLLKKMFLIYVLTFLVQLLKGSLRCPREDSKF